MPLMMEGNQAMLISNILLASSKEEVKEIINSTLLRITQDGENTADLPGFIDAVTKKLGSFSPMHEGVQQWSNIRMAKISLYRIRTRPIHPVIQ